jgi:hypothetical protein
MKKAMIYFLVFFVLVSAVEADGYEFQVHYRAKGTLSEHFDRSYKYIFEDRLLSAIEIERAAVSGKIVETKTLALKHFKDRVEAYENGELAITCRYVDANNMYFIMPDEHEQKILATRTGDMACIGMEEDILDRTIRITLGEEIRIRFLKNGKPINRDPSLDFDITSREESTVRYIEYPVKYEKIDEGVFDDVGYFDPAWPERFSRYIIANQAHDYDIHIAELFIDYYCGGMMASPLIWGQLIMNSDNKLSSIYKTME